MFSGWFALLFSTMGLATLVYRVGPALLTRKRSFAIGEPIPNDNFVSIVIPARNEEANLPRLLESLRHVQYGVSLKGFEVIIVDDESTDCTRKIALDFQIRNPLIPTTIVGGQARPAGWTGKNWACRQGFLQARGTHLLFTDADTEHVPSNLERCLKHMTDQRLDFLTALPFHTCGFWWEKILGPFQIMILLSTAAYSQPKVGRMFAIGQYLLFTREGYVKQGGHEQVLGTLAEDLELAAECLRRGHRMGVEKELVFEVRMYPDLKSFINGWRRIIRLGFKHARVTSSIEVFFVIACLTASFGTSFRTPWMTALLLALFGASWILVALLQQRAGRFSFFGILIFPWSLAVFTLVSGLALFDLMTGQGYTWRTRAYVRSTDGS